MGVTKAKDANMKFLFGSVFFFFILLMMIMLFGYFTLDYSIAKDPMSDNYVISFSKQFEGEDYDLYLNDSLLYEGRPVDADTVIRVSCFEKENALILVEKRNDIATVLQIGTSGKIYICFDKNGEAIVDIKELQ